MIENRMERVMGLEPTTISLATRCSTTELRPLGCMRLIYTVSEKFQVAFCKKIKNKRFSSHFFAFFGSLGGFFCEIAVFRSQKIPSEYP